MAITPGLGFDSDRWPERPSLFWRDRRASCIFSSFPPQLSISRIESAFAVPLRLALMPLVSHKIRQNTKKCLFEPLLKISTALSSTIAILAT
jgi:hypothetical protein